MKKEPTRTYIPLPEYAIKNLFNLKKERETRSLLQRDLSNLTGISVFSIATYETATKPQTNYSWRNYQKLATFFGWEPLHFHSRFYRGLKIFAKKKPVRRKNDYSDLLLNPIEPPKNKTFIFSPNSVYTIYLSKYVPTDFIYVEKKYRFHFWRNVPCGWLLTLTDAQLIGKKIKLKQEVAR